MDIGIDLGTTFSVVAVPGRVELSGGYPEGIYIEECDVTIIPAPDANPTFPSVLWEDPDNLGEFVAGMDAKQAAERGGDPIMWSKRKIGTTELLPLGARRLTAKVVATEVLKALKRAAEQALGQPVRRAVVTHPAYFDRSQVEETREAAQAAGFDMVLPEQMLMEPVAAALAYVRSDPKDPLKVLIYDLGGGTFDVTILERRGGVIAMKAFDGDHLLGGANFDRKLMQWVLGRLQEKGRHIPYNEANPEHRSWRAQLLQLMEKSKEKLADVRTKKQKIEIRCNFLVDEDGREVQLREMISQEEFVSLIREELDLTIECSKRCLEMAKLEAQDLDYLLLVGGSTYGPWVEDAVREAFGGVNIRQFRPDLCVAAGAAIQTQLLPAVVDGQTGLELELKLLAETPLQSIDVAGTVRRTDGQPLGDLQVLLSTQERTWPPAEISSEGQFLVEEVELLDEEPTLLVIQVIDNQGIHHLVYHHTITYAPKSSEISEVRTVLPKPLYVNTADGMIPLAKMGEPLPSKVEPIELKRLFDGASLDIDIYQEDKKAGTIAIKDIPEKAGQGTKVILRLEVTEKNEIKGVVEFLVAGSGIKAHEWPVSITFPPAEIPDIESLKAKWQELEDARDEAITWSESPEQRMALAGKGKQLSHKIQNLMKESKDSGADRQELDRALNELDKLVHPPQDDMDPPKAQFDGVLLDCRELLQQQEKTPQTEAMLRSLDKYEREGKDAFTHKDRKKWGQLFEGLLVLSGRLRKREEKSPSPQELPETPMLKDHFLLMLEQARGLLEQARKIRLEEDPQRYETLFKGICDQTAKRIDEMESGKNGIDKIPDDCPKNAALSKLQLAVRDLKAVEKDIENIKRGIFIGKA